VEVLSTVGVSWNKSKKNGGRPAFELRRPRILAALVATPRQDVHMTPQHGFATGSSQSVTSPCRNSGPALDFSYGPNVA